VSESDTTDIPVEVPDPPVWLVPGAVKEWHRVTRLMLANNLITAYDLAVVAEYCQTWGMLDEIEGYINLVGVTNLVQETSAGLRRPDPLWNMRTTLMDQLKRLVVELGLTPTKRPSTLLLARAKMGNTTQATDGPARFFP
jgi:P27 family predicted phage terminase small subunit